MTVYVINSSERCQRLVVRHREEWELIYQWFDGRRLVGRWKPLEVEVNRMGRGGVVEAAGDFFVLGTRIPVLSGRAVGVLQPMLNPNGELLPLSCEEGDYWAYNVTKLSDALDEACSQVAYIGKFYLGVARAAFRAEKLAGLTIFKVREAPRGFVYVTDPFVRAVKRAGLRGFVFEREWPRRLHRVD